jgi:hypothetical protein
MRGASLRLGATLAATIVITIALGALVLRRSPDLRLSRPIPMELDTPQPPR